jgi:hypothetical protein
LQRLEAGKLAIALSYFDALAEQLSKSNPMDSAAVRHCMDYLTSSQPPKALKADMLQEEYDRALSECLTLGLG